MDNQNNPFAGLISQTTASTANEANKSTQDSDDDIISNHLLEQVFHITLDSTQPYVYMETDSSGLLTKDNIDDASF